MEVIWLCYKCKDDPEYPEYQDSYDHCELKTTLKKQVSVKIKQKCLLFVNREANWFLETFEKKQIINAKQLELISRLINKLIDLNQAIHNKESKQVQVVIDKINNLFENGLSLKAFPDIRVKYSGLLRKATKHFF